MSKCVDILGEVTATIEGELSVGMPDICDIVGPPECPMVIVTPTQWIINGVSIRLLFDTDLKCQTWSRWRDTDEFGVNPGPWSDWKPDEAYPIFDYPHDARVAADLIPYNWYDMQLLVEPEGLDGYQEQHPFCGVGWAHLQTPKKDFPDPDPPIPVNPQ